MPPTLTRSLPPSTTASPGRTAAGWAAAGIAALVCAAGAGEVLHPPGSVDVVLTNESEQDVTVLVATAGGGALPIATLDPGEERMVAGVLDRGDDWVVSFRTAGEPAVDVVELPRTALEADDFRITVPADVAPAGADAEGATEG